MNFNKNQFNNKSLKPRTWLITGVAGFIGMHTCLRFLERGDYVIGIDNLNDYYDISLKKARLSKLELHKNFSFYEQDIADRKSISILFENIKPQGVIHLAAQAGVRYSVTNPHVYIDSNLQGFINILEGCRVNTVEHLVYASSSSVYGGNRAMPFSEHQNVDHPVSLYAATKKANELMAHAYSHLYGLPTTGLRFFTVYGPWGRPDMALFLFTKAILDGNPINIFNNGNMIRDFTYVDDIVEGMVCIADKPAIPSFASDEFNMDPAISNAPYRIFNIGNNQPITLMDYIFALEKELNITANKKFLPMQPGDMQATSADISEIYSWIGFKPKTSIQKGISNFVNWYRTYYKI